MFAKTKVEAAAKLREALTARDNGLRPAPGRETVATYLLTWLAGVEPTLRPRTADSYAQIVRTHLAPNFARVPLGRLTPQFGATDVSPSERHGPLREDHRERPRVLHTALDQAFRWRLVSANVADLVDPPRVARREMHALSPDEARQVLAAAEGEPLEPLFRLAITAGLRLGELLALRWPEVDLERHTLSVVATLEQRHGHQPVVAEPKTGTSRRQVHLGSAVVEDLRRHRLAQPGIGFVFTRGDGRPLSRSIVDKAWTRLNERAGVHAVRFHDLRHTAATLLLGRGVHPKIVSEMLGNATVAITLDLYSHVTPTMQREAAATMDQLLGQ